MEFFIWVFKTAFFIFRGSFWVKNFLKRNEFISSVRRGPKKLLNIWRLWPKTFRLSANFLWLVFQNFIPRVKKTKTKKKVYSGESKVLVFFKIWSRTVSDIWPKEFVSVIKTSFDVARVTFWGAFLRIRSTYDLVLKLSKKFRILRQKISGGLLKLLSMFPA